MLSAVYGHRPEWNIPLKSRQEGRLLIFEGGITVEEINLILRVATVSLPSVALPLRCSASPCYHASLRFQRNFIPRRKFRLQFRLHLDNGISGSSFLVCSA